MRRPGLLLLGLVLAVVTASGTAFAEAKAVPTEPQYGIPLVIVHVDEQAQGYGTIEEMNASEDHSVRCTGSVEIKVPAGFQGDYGVDTALTSGAAADDLKLDYIRGRGNSTWTEAKKPYKIKFQEKLDLFGMGKDKEWALMASAMDTSLMRNRITSWLGTQMGMPYMPQMIPVDLVMVGSGGSSRYLGSYYLSETVKTGKNRVAIDALDPDVEALTGEPNITGGYLIPFYSVWQNSDEPRSTVFRTKHGLELFNKEPAYDDRKQSLTAGEEAQRKYIRDYIQEVEDRIMEPETIDREAHEAIAEVLDLQSAADYWWLQEFALNGDGYATSSTYLYKGRNGKLCFGPLWDFDLAWGSDMGIEDASEGIGFNAIGCIWIDQLRAKDPWFVELLKERWQVLDGKLQELTKAGGPMDKYKGQLAGSRDADVELWRAWFEANDRADDWEDPGTYEDVIDELRANIDIRREGVNKGLDDLKNVYATVTCQVDGREFWSGSVRRGTHVVEGAVPDAPARKGYLFAHWVEKETGERMEYYKVKKAATFVPKYVADKDVVEPKALYFAVYEDWMAVGDTAMCGVDPIKTILPEHVTRDTIRWESSDESILTIGPDGTGKFRKPGDVTITGTMHNGVKNSYVIHVYDPEKDKPEAPTALKLEASPLTIKVGETAQISGRMQPEGKVLYHYFLSAETQDTSIVDYNDTIVTGLKPGKAKFTVIATLFDENYNDAGKLRTTCEVIVTGDSSPAALKANPLKVKGKTVKVKRSRLRKHKVKIKRSRALAITGAAGELTYRKVSLNKKKYNKKFRINRKTGKITVRKGVKKGIYKMRVKVTAAGTGDYKPASRTVTVKIRVK